MRTFLCHFGGWSTVVMAIEAVREVRRRLLRAEEMRKRFGGHVICVLKKG